MAVLGGWPWNDAMSVWNEVSPSPGTLEATTSISGKVCLSSRIASALTVWSRTACDDAPWGGITATARIFSDPALMNWVGSCETSESEARNRTAAMPRTAQRLTRLRRARLTSGV